MDFSDRARPPEPAPEGATCEEHPDRAALVRCPRCGGDACLACWHHAVGRCVRCLAKDPTAGSPPVPFEDRNKNVVARFVGTLAGAFRPTATSNAMARAEIRSALLFAAIVAVPLAALRGVIPYTRTLLFGDAFHVETVGSPSSSAIALDVARAMGLSVAEMAILFFALTIPFASLSRAYGVIPGHRAALRLMLYRAWLLPLSFDGIVFHLAIFASPNGVVSWVALVARLVEVAPLVALFIAMRSTARLAYGVGPFISLAVVLVPLVLLSVMHLLVVTEMQPLVPPPPQPPDAAEQAPGPGATSDLEGGALDPMSASARRDHESIAARRRVGAVLAGTLRVPEHAAPRRRPELCAWSERHAIGRFGLAVEPERDALDLSLLRERVAVAALHDHAPRELGVLGSVVFHHDADRVVVARLGAEHDLRLRAGLARRGLATARGRAARRWIVRTHSALRGRSAAAVAADEQREARRHDGMGYAHRLRA